MAEFDPDNVVDFFTQRALLDVSSTYDDEEHDPDKAAKAVELSRTTGVPAAVIHEDQDRFMQEGKQALAHGIVSSNPYIQDYIMSHPLAAKVSSDDWGPLNEAMSIGLKHATKSILQKTFEGFKENANFEQFEGEMNEFDNLLARNPLFGSIFYQQVLRSDVHDIGKAYRAISGILGAVAGGAGEFASQTGLLDHLQPDPMLRGEAGKNRFVRDALVALQTSLSGQEGPAGPGLKPRADALKQFQAEVGEEIQKQITITDANGRVYPPSLIKPYLEAGEEPPVGVHPEIDKVKAEQARLDLKWLQEFDSAVQKTATQGRSPEMSELAIRQVIGDQPIELDAGAIRKIYGDKPPTLDDGLLGWIPDLADKLSVAEQTGGDIEVPLASWIARTDPEVKRALKDFIRVRPDGISSAEKELYKGYEEAVKGGEIKPPLSSGDPIVDGIRSAAGLDSVFDADRVNKLNIEKVGEEKGGPDWPAGGVRGSEALHEFSLKNTAGDDVGKLSIHEMKGGKELYVSFIGAGPKIGPEGAEPRMVPTPGFLGPRVVRDILAQIKEQFPNAEAISGVRVSGARAEASATGFARISLDAPEQEMLRRISDELGILYTRKEGAFTATKFKEETLSDKEKEIANKVTELLNRITPQASKEVVQNIEEPGYVVRGLQTFDILREVPSIIYVSTDGTHPIGTARHEAIHHLRMMGLFSTKEWGALEDAARAGNWLDKYNIDKRYASSSLEKKMEEAIAEGYKEWGDGKVTVEGVVAKLFERIKELLRQIADMLRDPDAQRLFQRIEKGEIGQREQFSGEVPGYIRDMMAEKEPELPQAEAEWKKKLSDIEDKRIAAGKQMEVLSREKGFNSEEFKKANAEYSKLDQEWYDLQKQKPTTGAKQLELPQAGTTRMEDRPPITGKAINLSEKAMSAILKAIHDREDALWEQQKDKLEKDELRKQSKEWKDNTAALREDVEKEVYQRADIGADQLIRKGMLDGIRVKGKIPKIDPQFLTPAQRARLPKDYFAAKGEGFHIDDFARLFKFDSGDALVERLALLEEGRKQSGLEGKAFIDRLIKDTTDLRMEEKYGDKAANAIQEARDKFVGEKDLRVIHEEILGIQEAIGDQRTITKDKLEEGILTNFNKETASKVKAKKELRDSGKLDKAATVELFVNKNPAGWLSNKMAQYKAIYEHGLATKLEKEWDRFQDTLKNLKARSSDTMDQGYRNIIHTVMEQIGVQPKRLPGDLQESLVKTGVGNNLAEFKLHTFDKTWGMDDLQVPEFLLDPKFKKDLNALTVEEFRAVKTTIDALATKGRAVHNWDLAGESMSLDKAIDNLLQGVQRFPYKEHDVTPTRMGKLLNLPRTFLANSTAFETFARRMDAQDPYGPWMRMLMYPLAKAANYKDVLLRKYAKQLKEVGPITQPEKLLESPPLGIKVNNFTVNNLQVMIHNMGNEAQWEHFARGWGADPDVLKQWVFNQVTRLDGLKEGWGKQLFDRAQKMGNVWESAFTEAKAEYMKIYGNFPEGIQLKPIQTPYGEAKGWYHPQIPDLNQKAIFDKDGKKIAAQSEKQKEPSLYDSHDNFHARTFNGYTKKRTGAFYPMSLDSNMIPVRLTQMLHDIAFRETLIQSEKLLRNDRLYDGVSHHYGPEYAKGFMPYLRGIAGQEGIPSSAWGDFNRLSSFIRDNVISSYIAFNPSTPLKHGPSAWLMSMFQVGVAPFFRFRRPFAMGEQAPKEWLEAAKDLYGHQMDMNLTNKEFVDRWSEEVGRRKRFWQETIGGQTKLNMNQVGMFSSVFSRENIIQKGSWLVAQSDMISVRPTWLAAYRKAMLDTKNNHELSVSVADQAVRLQHGSTAVTNFPAIVRDANNWFTAIYGFWGTIMQRRIELAHQIADTYRMDISDKEFGQMYKNSAGILAKVMVYYVWPAVVEEYVTGLFTEDRRGLGERILDAAIHSLGASEIGIRDIAQLFKGHINLGLASSFLDDTSKTLRSLKKGTEMFNRKNAGETVQNIMTTFGELRGVHPRAFSNAERYGLDLFTEQQQPPEDTGELFRGVARGKAKARVIK